MKKCKEEYSMALKRLDELKNNLIDCVVYRLKIVATKPVHIGNHWFYYVNHNGKDVPAYCHFRNYDEKNPKFLPIYDSENTGEFGWSDFMECCRIFDLILEHV